MSNRVEFSRAVLDQADWQYQFEVADSSAFAASNDGVPIATIELNRDRTKRTIWVASHPVYRPGAAWYDALFDGELRLLDDNLVVFSLPLQWNGTTQPLKRNGGNPSPVFVTFSDAVAIQNAGVLTSAPGAQPNLRVWLDGVTIGSGDFLYPTRIDLSALTVNVRAQRAQLVCFESATAASNIFIAGMAVMSEYP